MREPQRAPTTLPQYLLAPRVRAPQKVRPQGCDGVRKFETYDKTGKLLYTMEVNDCKSKSGGSNLCAPSCCNESLTVDITDATGTLVTPSHFVFPGARPAFHEPSLSVGRTVRAPAPARQIASLDRRKSRT